jgi:hypothetical protein
LLKRRGVKELGGLLILFVLLIAFATFYEQVGQERVASNAPTTTNTRSEGVRALFLLYVREGLRTDTLKAPWSELGDRDGLLVFVEPPDPERQISLEDIKTLEKWVRAGGTLLDLVSDPPIEQPFSPSNSVTGDCGATAGDPTPHPVTVDRATNSPLLDGVETLFVSSGQRLTLAKGAPYTVLARDPAGVIAVDKALGKGHVVLVANRFGATNAGIAEADNAAFLVNVALRASDGRKRAVRFDEYHHGVGFTETAAAQSGGVWASTPLPLRLGFLHLVAASLLLIYTANRRFGPVQSAPQISHRASTDYVNSMARLYRRAGAADIAIESLYLRFVRDLRRALDVPADAGITQIVRLAEQRFGPSAAGLQALLLRGEAVVAGQRVSEPDMLNLARQIEQFRRVCQLVGV